MAVAVSDALAQLEQKGLDLGGRERGGVGALAVGIDEFFEIGIEVLKDEVKEGLAVLLVVQVLNGEEANDVDRIGEHLE